MLEATLRQVAWKHAVKNAVLTAWTKKLQKVAQKKTSLSILNTDLGKLGALHPKWQDLYSLLDIRKATIKAQLLVRRYPGYITYRGDTPVRDLLTV